MKISLLGILACPACKHHPLDLEVVDGDAVEVIEGRLYCARCGSVYLITESIPDLLPTGL